METSSVGERLQTLQACMRQMVNAPEFSNVVFLCNDGKQVWANRTWLVGSSEMFKCMLSNGMVESSASEIELPTISSPTLLAVIEFIYTRTNPVNYRPQSWTMACEVMMASQFFLLPELESVIRTVLQEQIFAVAGDLKKSASLLTEALEFNGLFDERDSLLWDLVNYLGLAPNVMRHIPSLSEDAFNYLLVNTKVNFEDECEVLSVTEYIRFKQVIYWWVCNSDLGSRPREELQELVDCMVPTSTGAKSLCENQGNEARRENAVGIVARLSNEWKSCQLDAKPRNSTIRLLSNINCRLIHPALLSTVVEPLKIISAETILDSFRFHAVQRTVPFFPNIQLRWEHSDSFKISQKGRVVQRAAERVGLAVLTMSRCGGQFSEQLFTWVFDVEELCEGFTELGLFYYSSEVHAKKSKFDGERLSDQACTKVLKFQGSQAYINVEGPGGRVDWELLGYERYCGGNISVRFGYCASTHTCSLNLNGRIFRSLWTNLPSRMCYPAVSFGNSSKGRVRVRK